MGFTQSRADLVSGYWLIGYVITQDMVVANLHSPSVRLELKDVQFLNKVNHNLLVNYVCFSFSTTSLVYESVAILLDPIKNQIHNLWTRRVINSQWERGCFGGLGAKPPTAGGWEFGGFAPNARKFCIFLQK